MPTRDNLKWKNKISSSEIFEKTLHSKTCLERPLSEKKFICIDRNGIVEENFEKRRILHRKGGENSINWNIKMWEIYYETCNDIIQNVSKVHFLFLILMVPTQVSKIPTLF